MSTWEDKWKEWSTATVLQESHYDRYYHFTELPEFVKIVESNTFKFAGAEHGEEDSFRGGKGYMSLTRVPNLEHGFQYQTSNSSHGGYVRLTLNGQKLNNIRNVKISPLDFIYNWNKQAQDVQAGKAEKKNVKGIDTGRTLNFSALDASYGKVDNVDKLRSGRSMATDRDSNYNFYNVWDRAKNKEVFDKPVSIDRAEEALDRVFGFLLKMNEKGEYERLDDQDWKLQKEKNRVKFQRDQQKRQYISQAEESLVLTDGRSEINNFGNYVDRVDIWVGKLFNKNGKIYTLGQEQYLELYELLLNSSWAPKIFVYKDKKYMNHSTDQHRLSLKSFVEQWKAAMQKNS